MEHRHRLDRLCPPLRVCPPRRGAPLAPRVAFFDADSSTPLRDSPATRNYYHHHYSVPFSRHGHSMKRRFPPTSTVSPLPPPFPASPPSSPHSPPPLDAHYSPHYCH